MNSLRKSSIFVCDNAGSANSRYGSGRRTNNFVKKRSIFLIHMITKFMRTGRFRDINFKYFRGLMPLAGPRAEPTQNSLSRPCNSCCWIQAVVYNCNPCCGICGFDILAFNQISSSSIQLNKYNAKMENKIHVTDQYLTHAVNQCYLMRHTLICNSYSVHLLSIVHEK